MTDKAQGPTRGWARHVVACAVLVAVTVAAFHGSLAAEFVYFDDPILVEYNQAIRALNLETVRRAFTPYFETDDEKRDQPAWLPLRQLSYAVDYHMWGLNAFGYHMANLVLHAANVLLAYAVLLSVLRRPGLALLGAAWFAVHPVQVEAVTWVSGRRDVLFAFFALLTFLSFMGFERREGRGRWLLYAASVLCCGCSLLSKASAMMVPVVVGAGVVVLGRQRDGVRRSLMALVPHAVMAAAAVAVHLAVAQSAGVVKARMLGTRAASVPWALASYLRLIFFPVGMATPYGRRPLAFSDMSLIVMSSGAVLAAVGVAWWAASRRRNAVFGMAWWLLFLLPVSNLVPLSIVLAERYLYMPLLGACIVGADAVGRLSGRLRRIGVVCAVASVLFLGSVTHMRQAVWQDSLAFWRQAVGEWPGAPVCRLGLGTTKLHRNQPDQAWGQYMRVAVAGEEAWSLAHSHVSHYKKGLRRCYVRLGRAREAQGDTGGAIRIYQEAVRLLQGEAEPHVRLGEAYERAGLTAMAIQQAQAVKAMDPDRPGLGAWIARLQLSGSGR